jgi:hypothetical protein
MSTATSMSSVSSHGGFPGGPKDAATPPPLPTPPAPPVKSNNRGSSKAPGAYWCTFCDVAFQRKFDWKRHEDEFHERYKRYPCPNCNRIFWGANTFNQHHKNAHGCTTCPHAERVVRYTQKKTAWYVATPCFSSPISLSVFISPFSSPVRGCLGATPLCKQEADRPSGHAASAAGSKPAVTVTLIISPGTTKTAATNHTGTTRLSSTAYYTSRPSAKHGRSSRRNSTTIYHATSSPCWNGTRRRRVTRRVSSRVKARGNSRTCSNSSTRAAMTRDVSPA